MHLQKPNLYSKGFLIKTVSFGNNLSIFGRFSAQKAPTLQSVVHTLHTNYSTLCSACQYSAWFFVENRLVSFPELAKCAVSALLQKRASLRLPCVKGAVGASRLKDCFFTTLPPLRGPPPLTQGRLFISVRGPPEPVSATPASMLRTLANPLHRGGYCGTLSQGRL